MPPQQKPERHLAMLIDGDNAQHKLIKEMLEEVSRYGTVTTRRAYGDWVQPNMANWRDAMLAHAIQPIQQWRYTNSKNATDSALIIDAMDILYSGSVQGFCIVSSDSDYTRLCMRIRESGFFVMGMGRKQTPEAFINACDVFVHVENLSKPTKNPQPAKTPIQSKPKPNAKLLELFRRAFDIAESDNGWVHLGMLGQALHRLDPSFDSRTHGYKNLSLLVKSMPSYINVRGAKKTEPSAIYVSMKEDV